MSNQTLPYGVDLSKYQYSDDGTRKINFDKLNPLISFCGVRAGISWGYTDPWYAYTKAHLLCPRMDYHVIYPGESATRQMDHFLQITNPGEHDRQVLDLELAHGYSKARITQTTIACLERLKAETGRYPIIYSRASWVNTYLQVSDLPTVDWWLAHYLSRRPAPLYTPEHPGPPTLPNGVSTWLVHQTGERGNGGAHGVASYYIDQNRWNGTKEELQAYFGLTEEAPVPPPADVLFEARVYSWATPYVNIRAGAGTQYAKVGKAGPLSVHGVYGVVGDWYKIPQGYVMSKYLEPLEATPPIVIEPEKPLFEAVVTTVPPNRLRVRRTPNGELVRWLQSGDTVSVYQEQVGWYRVGDGEWASSDYLQRVFYRPDLMNVPLFSQRDPRWANDRMGLSTITLGQQGCLVTCTAAGLTYLGYAIDPKEYNRQASIRGGYQSPNLMYWKFPDVLTEGKVARAEYSGWYASGRGWEALADTILSSDRPVWAHVDFDRETVTIEQHWVLIIGKDTNGYWVYDPWLGAIASLTARYGGLVFRVVSYRRVK